ncbi:MAG: Stk1 family PASTA domain-containing Ser/Thr kinase [Mycobacterium sp.]
MAAEGTPPRLSDRYELGDILGFGGMSEVHIAHDIRLDRVVAVKVLRADLGRDPNAYLRFRREAQHTASLNHPAIVAVHDTGEAHTDAGSLPYIVMEYVDGATLRDIVHDDGPMSADQATEVMAVVCEALQFSHTHGIIHRDVKPANIMIRQDGAVKVMDFGIARVLADTRKGLTQTAAVIGTPQYLSPEQASGEKGVDARSDIYSTGCVLYELLCGQPPFDGDSPVAVAYQHVREDVTPPSQHHDGISAALDSVVLKALAKNPDNRYQTATELRDDLIKVQDGEMPSAPRVFTEAELSSLMDDAAGPGLRRRSVRRWVVAVAMLTVLTVIVTIALMSGGADTRAVQVPDVHNLSYADAVAALQNRGFTTRRANNPDSEVAFGKVIDTDPGANSSAPAGTEITINVSYGPQPLEIPSVAGLTYPDAEKKLNDAGFLHVTASPQASPSVPRDTVIGTNPPAQQTSPVTNDITVLVSQGPQTAEVPDVAGQTADLATRNLNIAGFSVILTAPTDGYLPSGQVIGTYPPARTGVAIDTAITLKVSKGNQIQLPDLTGQFYDELTGFLDQLGFVGTLLSGPALPAGDQGHFRVVHQEPPAGSGVNRDGVITVNYGA